MKLNAPCMYYITLAYIAVGYLSYASLVNHLGFLVVLIIALSYTIRRYVTLDVTAMYAHNHEYNVGVTYAAAKVYPSLSTPVELISRQRRREGPG